ncbi:MAG: PD-(D/E)XK nuclease family protein, partial [Desulfovibrio sp.]|nr:PD-(D/E)XK nuclease family protein [Desulfovibrio sp.]
MSSLTKALSGAVDLIEMLRERELNEASGFSPFAEELVYMGETGVCRILKILLSPKASHGQGARFLEAILALVPEAGFDAPNERFIKVGVERQLWELGSNRRVDIVVDCPR